MSRGAGKRGHIEGRYDFVLEPDGRLWIAIMARDTDVDRPMMAMNDDGTLTLKRRPGDLVQLTDIHPEALKRLPNMGEIEVVEVDEEDGPIRTYKTVIRRR
ncbi:MAG: hypothetical protein KI792_11930 [Alphaproteobacteria bacterium]|nr:hypothetical protein [Alphaproteobacteria bacterium SS10]